MIVVNSFYVNNKAVVGSSCRDVPKYMGEGVVSRGPPGESSRSKSMLFHEVFHEFS